MASSRKVSETPSDRVRSHAALGERISDEAHSEIPMVAQPETIDPPAAARSHLLRLRWRPRGCNCRCPGRNTKRNATVVVELADIIPWLEQIPLDDALWQQLTDWSEAAQTTDTQELLNTLLIELYPESVDMLEDASQASLHHITSHPWSTSNADGCGHEQQ